MIRTYYMFTLLFTDVGTFIGKIAVDETICPVKATDSCSVPHSPYKLPFCNLQTFTATKREWQLMKGCSFQSDNRYETTLSAGKWESMYPWSDNRLATCHNYSINGWRFDAGKGHWEILSAPSPKLLTNDARDFLRSWRDSVFPLRLHATVFRLRYNSKGSPCSNWYIYIYIRTVICSVTTVPKVSPNSHPAESNSWLRSLFKVGF